MKKLLMSICMAMLVSFSVLGFSSCFNFGGNPNQEAEQQKDAPVISNKPTDNTLTITVETNTYQFELAEYDGNVTWISTVTSVATISQDGLLTMLDAGYTEVIVKDTDSGLSDSVVLTVIDETISDSLAITGVPQTIRAGDESVQLSVVTTENAPVSATYRSSNSKVATVSETGVLTPLAKGTTTITAIQAGTNLKAKLRVEVLGAEITSVSITGFPKYGMLLGDSIALNATCEPQDCEDYEIEWSVNNTDVAVLDGLNNLIAIDKGECTVTATVKGTEITTSKTFTVSELSKYNEDFRFATVGTSNVQKVGPTITLTNTDAEIVDYGKDQALKISTRANNAYNCFTIDFGELEAGNYKFSMTFKVVEGRHSGAMVMDGASSEFGYIMATTALGNDTYCFYFNQETAGTKKIVVSAQQWTTYGEAIVDNIALEKVNTIPKIETVGTIDDSTFDSVEMVNGQNSDINGVYVSPRKFATELVADGNGGKALKVTRVENGYGYIALSLGDIEAANYTLTMDIQNSDYQAILQVIQIQNSNGLWKAPVVQDIKYGEMDTIFEQATKNGNTYTLYFSAAKAYKNFAIGLSTNLSTYNGESIIIDNISLKKTSVSQTIDFESEQLGVVSTFVGAGDVDFGKALVVTSKEITDKGYVTESGNTYYKATFKGWNTYSLFNFGTLDADKYVIEMDAKLLRGTMKGRFVARINGTISDLVEGVDYTKNGDTYTFTIELTETCMEFCIGYRSVSNDNADFTLAYDNISIRTETVVLSPDDGGAPEGVAVDTYNEWTDSVE